VSNIRYPSSFPHIRHNRGRVRASASLLGALLALACSSEQKPDPKPAGGPFESVEAVAPTTQEASYGAIFAATHLSDDTIAFIARQRSETADAASPFAVFSKRDGEAARVLYAGGKLRTPFDIDVANGDGDAGGTLYVADMTAGEAGSGAILVLSASGGEPSEQAVGFFPRGVTVAPDGRVYFSGRDPESGQAGVFTLEGNSVSRVFTGAPLVDPSGIAVLRDGRVIVADTQLFALNSSSETPQVHTEAGLVSIEAGRANVLSRIPHTGYPAGLAATEHESVLVVSGLASTRSNTVYLVNLADPAAEPAALTAPGGNYQSSAGLHRMSGKNTFAWADASENSGAVYRITVAANL